MGKSNKDKKLSLSIDSKTRCLNIKVYYDQLYRFVHGNLDIVSDDLKQIKAISDNIINQSKVLSDAKKSELKKEKDALHKGKVAKLKAVCVQEGILADFFNAVQSIDKDLYFVSAILHDKDVFVEDFWTTEPEDDHIHIVFHGALLPSGKMRTFIVSKALEMLHISFDPDTDKSILDYGAIEVCKHIADSVKYLTHSTPASEIDGKYPYDHNEVITNNREKYDEYVNSVKQASAKVRFTVEDAIAYTPSFREAGSRLMSYRDAFRFAGLSDWLWSYCIGKQSVSDVLQDAYVDGLKSSIAMKRVDRICLFIYGEAEIGKTTAVEHLCDTLGISRDKIFVAVEGYGKYDGLTPQHEVLIADDISLTNMLTLAGENVAKLSQRRSGFAVFAGSFVIATSNFDPDEFFHKTMEDNHGNVIVDKNGRPRVNKQYEARITRFAIIRANSDGSLVLERPITRGSRNNTAFEKKAIVQKLIECMETSTKEYCSNMRMSPDDILKYPSYEVAKLCKTSPDADFVDFVEAHLEDFGDNLDLYYEAYNDNSPILYEDDFTFEDDAT